MYDRILYHKTSDHFLSALDYCKERKFTGIEAYNYLLQIAKELEHFYPAVMNKIYIQHISNCDFSFGQRPLKNDHEIIVVNIIPPDATFLWSRYRGFNRTNEGVNINE